MDDILTKHVYTNNTYKRETFPHSIEVEIREGVDFPKLNGWIEENIKGLWADISINSGYFMEFELEEDAVAFKLRWL